jgi:hypothetical protein
LCGVYPEERRAPFKGISLGNFYCSGEDFFNNLAKARKELGNLFLQLKLEAIKTLGHHLI